MSMPTKLGPPPSLDGLNQLISQDNVPANYEARRNTPLVPAHSNGAMLKSQSQMQASISPSSSSLLSPNHPINLRKQAKTHLDPTFSLKSYIGAANALYEKARSSDAQGQAEQAFVNYLKSAE
jgi:hypothetical protein